ncbi:MAG: nucleotide exchange factor GrpE [Anaerolineae bacterium]|jgi:molecular chaperone GrpE|nr:nucleotide exchange factor GrpE [Anaerolineae bacterium]
MNEQDQMNNVTANDGALEGEAAGALELEQKLAQAEAQAAEYLDNWRRSVAELSNARKRMAREQEETVRGAAARVLERLLPVLDDVDRAFANVPPEQANSEWVSGFRMIQRKLEGVLESEGVTPIAAAGEHFDPHAHYAVTYEEADGLEEGQIIAEVARGYKLGDKVLRPSMVRVAKG